MAKYTDAKCRLCRREGTKLFLKGSRCFSRKCPVEKKGAVPPGQHGLKRTRRLSNFGQQLREKQKAKRLYGVLEKQFKNYFRKASLVKKGAGEKLLQLLELRLDNVVYRLGLVPSRSVARQLVNHGQVLVDGKKTSIVSYQLAPGQVVSLSEKGMKVEVIKDFLKSKPGKPPAWLSRKAAVGKVVRLPKREEIETDIDQDLIVEFYSR